MPCQSYGPDIGGPSSREVAASQVLCLLSELKGEPIDKSHWRGYHPDRHTVNIDAITADLCAAIQNIDVTKQSLEMQIWWRDHQIADKARLEAELKDAKLKEEKEAALAKLTPYERSLLGLDD
jgi:hypothetical protein